MYKITVVEEEKLNKKGEYVKTTKQVKSIFGLAYKRIISTSYNRITQDVLDAVEENAKESGISRDKGKLIGFGN